MNDNDNKPNTNGLKIGDNVLAVGTGETGSISCGKWVFGTYMLGIELTGNTVYFEPRHLKKIIKKKQKESN